MVEFPFCVGVADMGDGVQKSLACYCKKTDICLAVGLIGSCIHGLMMVKSGIPDGILMRGFNGLWL
jgi:hypothetical protein